MKIVWKSLTAFGLAVALTSAGFVVLANAADIDAPVFEATEETRVEFGTGWYIRGEISYQYSGDFYEAEESTLIPGGFDQRSETVDESNGFGAGFGFGMRVTPNFRIDAGYEYLGTGERETSARTNQYRPPCDPAEVESINTTTGVEFINPNHRIDNCIESEDSSYFMQRLAIGAVYDFDQTFLGARPFVGAGIGVVRNVYTSTTGTLTCTPTEIERCKPNDGSAVPEFGEQFTQEGERRNGTSYHLAPSITAGLSFPISENLHLDTSYQYTHVFEDALAGGSNAFDNTDFPSQFHAVKVGLRLDIW